MNAFGALLWCAGLGLVVLIAAVVVAIHGIGPEGWRRTGRFYVAFSLLTLWLPLWLFTRPPGSRSGAFWILAAAVRQTMNLPLGLLGLALTGLLVWMKRRSLALAVSSTALICWGVFAFLFWSPAN